NEIRIEKMTQNKNWVAKHSLSEEKMDLAMVILQDVRQGIPVMAAVRRHPGKQGHISKSILVAAYNKMVELGDWEEEPALLASIRMKPVRTLSGVTTVTVLTKPYPCPANCIFCPDDARMPKSYLPDEPGAMRAVEHDFDPFDQVTSRLESLQAVGHPTDKVELLILGGTWSAYRKDYQEWFITRCYDALNGRDATSFKEAQELNETSNHRNVGLVVETRPDEIDLKEIAWLRHLGVTKIQMGVQSLDDRILMLNNRGHTVEKAHQAVALLRAAGFKIVLHWMPNLLGATIDSDREDFKKLWVDLCPDEIKIYPTQLLENAPLYAYWQRGEYKPYTQQELVLLLADIKPGIPRYCRVNRVIRDIPSTHVVEGNKRTSLRQDVHIELAKRGTRCQCIRCREIREKHVNISDLDMQDEIYEAGGAQEHFISFVTPTDKIAGFIRLSLPGKASPNVGLSDLEGAALIREVHVYGQSLAVGEDVSGIAQHSGLGTRLLEEAESIAQQHGFERISVIAAIGTRHYYLNRGYERGETYLIKNIATI
ncbi:MAG: elongator complex protein 3, partial [Anaerolineales bacterium]